MLNVEVELDKAHFQMMKCKNDIAPIFETAMRIDLPTTNDYSSVLQWSAAVPAQEEQWSNQFIISTMAVRLMGEIDTVRVEVGFWYEELVRQQTVEAENFTGQTVRTPG